MYEHLRALREDKDLSQKQLADLLQVHQTTYSDYERGNVNIPVPALIKLAEPASTIWSIIPTTQDPAVKENNLRRASPAAVTSHRNPAAERQRPQDAHQIESSRKRGCAAPIHSHTAAER